MMACSDLKFNCCAPPFSPHDAQWGCGCHGDGRKKGRAVGRRGSPPTYKSSWAKATLPPWTQATATKPLGDKGHSSGGSAWGTETQGHSRSVSAGQDQAFSSRLSSPHARPPPHGAQAPSFDVGSRCSHSPHPQITLLSKCQPDP